MISPGQHVIVRARDAGVHFGKYVKHEGRDVVIRQSRRLIQWRSSFSLSGLAVMGVAQGKESDCIFSMTVVEPMHILDACEIIPCTDVATQSIKNIPAFEEKS